MSKVAEFSRYVGLVVVISALILLAPRATVSAWAGAVGWLRSRWVDLITWRPRTMRAEPAPVPVHIQIPVRRNGDHPQAELLEHDVSETPRQAALALWGFSREVVEAGALALAVGGVALRAAARVMDVLPGPAVFAGDLLLVLATFLVMQRVIRDYPAHLLPSVLHPRQARPARVPAVSAPVRVGRVDHALQLVLLSVAMLVALAWPGELGTELARRAFGSASAPGTTAVVAWACELPWLAAVSLFLLRRTDRPAAAPAGTLVVFPAAPRHGQLERLDQAA